eukprot:7641101-Alexandrium_andersonii.AAC.1
MSASLVGSEMCIRDRFAHCRFRLSLTSNLPSDIRASMAPKIPGRKIKPVSYTHLTLPTICSV